MGKKIYSEKELEKMAKSLTESQKNFLLHYPHTTYPLRGSGYRIANSLIKRKLLKGGSMITITERGRLLRNKLGDVI